MEFVFLCLDEGYAKRAIVQTLLEWKVPFIDVGMGVERTDEMLAGMLRVTAVTAANYDHVVQIPYTEADANDEYSKGIQIADLNALNAALAVIKWKKLCGFYRDLRVEHSMTYTIDGNMLTNDEGV